RMNTTPCEVLKKEGFVRDKDLRKALLMGVDFSMTGRNKPVHGRFRQSQPPRLVGGMPETPVDGLIPAYGARKLFSAIYIS
ncbi:MAG: hypothetical protein NTX45_07270, partial [Proteobacteria bacterium]|nr:hypothetical protein [Pseudomonadota bacterium]